MDANILVDSSGEFIKDCEKFSGMKHIPFRLYVDGCEYIDDENLDVADFVNTMRNSSEMSRSACPPPQEFMDNFSADKMNFVVALSSALSGLYNSAEMAKKMYLEEHPEAKIYVFDSKSASIGETLVGLKIKECVLKGLEFENIIREVEEYIESQRTFFISERLDNLVKNGRIGKLKSKIVTALNIKPIMGSTPEGQIELYKKARGGNKAVQVLADLIKDVVVSAENRILAISHCENVERATMLKQEIEKRCNFKEILIIPTAGLSSLYVDYQGIILAF